MKKVLVIVVALFTAIPSYSQGEIDAFRFSRNDLQGTARVQAMGGAFGALGGDPSAVVINPAGLGVYRSSEVSTTLALSRYSITTNGDETQSKSKFNFDNISYIGYFPLVQSGIHSINFGFNYNRLKNFDRNYTGLNLDRTTSLTDYMVNLTNGYYPADMERNDRYLDHPAYPTPPWLGILGWNSGLMNLKQNATNSYESILTEGELVDSEIKSFEKGYVDAYDFSVGANVSDQFYFGLTFSLTDLYYQMSSTYWEDFSDGGGFALDNYSETSGSGYQLKVGAIYRPVDQLRLGISYHSPTWYSLTDIYQASSSPYGIVYDDGKNAEKEYTPDDAYTNYKLRTPYSWTFSLATILGAKAILSVDYEIKDYAAMNFKSNFGGDKYKEGNSVIDEDFRIASTVRLGLEYKLTPQLSGRLGYAWMENPYTDDFKNAKVEALTSGTIPHYTIEGNVSYYTAGLGYRFTPQFYMDLAFVYKAQTDDLYYFSPMPKWDLASESVAYKNNTYRGLVTLGYKF